MKVFAISDLHLSITNPKPMDIFGGAWDNYIEEIVKSWRENVSEEDIVLIAGDISWAMYLEDALSDLEFIFALPGKKILIRGNHDYWWKSVSCIRAVLKNNTYVLQNDAMSINGVTVCGTRGWTVSDGQISSQEDKKIFDREVVRLELSLKDAQKKRKENEPLIAMIHYPPFNLKLESSAFTNLFEKYNVSSVVYGHLHGKDSRVIQKLSKNGVDYFLTSCDLIGNQLKLITEI